MQPVQKAQVPASFVNAVTISRAARRWWVFCACYVPPECVVSGRALSVEGYWCDTTRYALQTE